MMNIFNKALIIVLFPIFTAPDSFGQMSFSHSIGGSFYMSSIASAPGIMYSPRFNLMRCNSGSLTTISIGTHLGMGFTTESYNGASYSSISLDVPLVVEINFGYGSGINDYRWRPRNAIGGFAGLGYGYSKIGMPNESGLGHNDPVGIVVNGGLQAKIFNTPCGLRLSYMFNLRQSFNNVFSIGLFYLFGES